MSDKKGSGLDIFDSLGKKKESGMPSDSGVVAKAQTSKAPPPPPSLSRPKASAPGAPMAPPSLAQLSAPVSRGSATPPPPPSSLKPQTPVALAPAAPMPLAPTPAPPPAFRPSAPPPPPRPAVASSPPARPSAPPPPSLRQPTPPPPTPRPSAPTPPSAPKLSAPTPPGLPPLSAPLPPPPAMPSALNAYSNDAEDDAPTRLYSPGSTPPPPQKTLPRNERPAPVSRGAAPPQSPQLPRPPPGKAALFPSSATSSADGKNKLYAVLAAAVVILAAGAVYWLGGRTGALTITVSGPGGRPVDGVEVFVDGAKRCDSSPCRISDLKPGAHLVRASAKGYQDTADQAISVDSGQQGTHNISLVTAGAGTGVRVSALGSGLRLYVDGQEIGELPQTAKNLTPGEHTIRVAGSDRYEPWEERITLDDGEMKTEGPLKLRVKKGLATFKAGPGADGARVLLDGRLVPELPATIEVPAGKQLTLVATKTGYSTYRRTVSFDDGIAEKSFEITMAEGSDESPAAPSTPPASETVSASNVAHAPAPGHYVAAAPPPPPPSREPAKGKAVINVNSIPVTNVILNGRPIGQTPKVGVQVTPGPQTVVFVHPDLGRKVMTGTVKAGETKTFMAKLP